MKLPAPPPKRTRVIHAAAALLLSYPDQQLLSRLDLVEAALAEVDGLDGCEATLAHLRSMPPMELQSWHVQEFDLSRRHALHLTYWTAGDTRRRGEVLAAMKQTYRDSGLLVDLDGELPDHLPMVLEFASSGAPALGMALLTTYRASLELLRMGLEKDKIPHAGVVSAICATLPGVSPQTKAEVQRLAWQTPTELVGLDPFINTGYPSAAQGVAPGYSTVEQMERR